MKSISSVFFILASCFCFSANAKDLYYASEPKGDISENIKQLVMEKMNQTIKNQHEELSHNKESAKYILNFTIDKLDKDYLARIEKCANKEPTSNCQYSSELKITSIDDIDVATERLTTSAIGEKEIEESKKIGSVTAPESREIQNSVRARRNWKLGLGMSGLFNLNADKNLDYSLLLGWSALISKQFAVNVDALFLFSDNDQNFSMLGLGPQYYFSDNDMAPYVKGAINFYAADNGKSSNGGIAFSGGGGVTLFRSSTVNMFLESGYIIGTKSLDNKVVSGIYLMTGIAF